MAESNLVAIPFKALCDAVASLNGVLEDKKMHIKTVGVKKEAVVAGFVERISDVIEAKADQDLPADVCAFYQNFLVNKAEKARPFTNKKVIAMLKAMKAPEGAAETSQLQTPSGKGAKKDATPSAAPASKKTSPVSTPALKKTTAPATSAPAKKVLVRKNAANTTKVDPAASSTPAKKGGGLTLNQNGKKSGLKAKPVAPGDGKKDPKKGSGRRGRGTGMVDRAVHLYVVEGITDSKAIAAVIDKEFPGTNNRSTISHVRCILGAIPAGHLKPVKK